MRGERAYSTLQPANKRTINSDTRPVEFTQESDFNILTKTVISENCGQN